MRALRGVALIYGTLARMPAERRQHILDEDRAFLAGWEASG
jgi:hypothetical protein